MTTGSTGLRPSASRGGRLSDRARGLARGRRHQADMGRRNPPTVLGANPDMALPAGNARAQALKLGIGGGKILSVADDHRILQVPRQIDRRTTAAERSDRVIAIQ